MSVRKLLGGLAVAGGLLVASPAAASANVMWCIGDPPTQVTSPAGIHFVVNTQIYVASRQPQANHHYVATTTSAPDGTGGTLVTVDVKGPAGQYMTVVARVNRANGNVTAQASGYGDATVRLDVPIS